MYLELTLDKAWGTEQTRKLVTTELLGKAAIPDLPYESRTARRSASTPITSARNEDRKPIRSPARSNFPRGKQRLKVWPISAGDKASDTCS